MGLAPHGPSLLQTKPVITNQSVRGDSSRHFFTKKIKIKMGEADPS